MIKEIDHISPHHPRFIEASPFVILQHDARDVDKLPVFPAAAK